MKQITIKTKGYDLGIVEDLTDEFIGMGKIEKDKDFPDQHIIRIKFDEDFVALFKKLIEEGKI